MGIPDDQDALLAALSTLSSQVGALSADVRDIREEQRVLYLRSGFAETRLAISEFRTSVTTRFDILTDELAAFRQERGHQT